MPKVTQLVEGNYNPKEWKSLCPTGVPTMAQSGMVVGQRLQFRVCPLGRGWQ